MRTSEPDATDHLPLKAPDLAILLVLSRGPSYGYGIVKSVAEASAGAVHMAPGNLYQVLDRMLTAGLVREAEADEVPATDDDGRRRWYVITGLGRRVAEAEAHRLDTVLGTARSLGLLGRGGIGP